MKTYSQLLNRESIDLSEVLVRAQGNDIVFGRADEFVDDARAIYPTRRYLTYALHRLCTPATAAAWDAYAAANAIDPEVAYVHHSAVRRQLQDGSGWYVMNMGSAQYLAWRRQRTLNAIAGTEFGGSPHSTGPMDGCDYDLTLWYSDFDAAIPPVALNLDPNPRVLDSDEYTGTGNLYQDQCKDDYVATRAAAGAGLMPNFGEISFAQETDANTLAVIAAADVIRLESCLRYDAGVLEVPTAADALTRWAFIDTQTAAGKDVLGQGWLDHAPQSQAHKDQAVIGTAAFFLMADSPRLYGRCILDISEPAANISNWEKNGLMRTATQMLGVATGSRTEAGAFTNVRLYYRDFTNGRVYICISKTGLAGTATDTLPSLMYPLDANGAYGAGATSVSLGVGDAAILWNGVIMGLTIVATPGASDANSYLTLAEADAYFFADPSFETWDRLDTIAKYRHMIRATRELDSEMTGLVKLNAKLTAGVPEQALVVPRSTDVENGSAYIPVVVKQACFQQIAANIQGSGAGFRQDLRAAGVVEIELRDGTREKYAEGAGSSSGSVLTTNARDLLMGAGFIVTSMGYA